MGGINLSRLTEPEQFKIKNFLTVQNVSPVPDIGTASPGKKSRTITEIENKVAEGKELLSKTRSDIRSRRAAIRQSSGNMDVIERIGSESSLLETMDLHLQLQNATQGLLKRLPSNHALLHDLDLRKLVTESPFRVPTVM